MYFYLVAPTTVVRSSESAFTYHSKTPLAIGTLVRISVGKRLVNGVVIRAVKEKPSFATKPIDTVLAPHPLPKPLLDLADWMCTYYATHLALVLQSILPAGLHKTRRNNELKQSFPVRSRTKIVLKPEQQKALMIISRHTSGTLLLHGVTGSGKTQVYIETAKQLARQGKSSIILVPEIALTPQLVAEFANHFQNLVVTHSRLTESQRHAAWLHVLQSSEPVVVIGPRSALFMPVRNLGAVVVDECHEPSYKQDQSPKYSALRAATMLASYHDQAKAILGSATPAIADYYLAQTTKRPIVKLPQTIVDFKQPAVDLIDYKNRDAFRRHRFLSDTLLEKIQETLAKNQQVLLFHNRRGTSPTTLCEQCGWHAECPTCFLPLTLHADAHQLRCHVCGLKQAVPPSCPVCREPTIAFKGIGTKLIEAEIIRIFPKAVVARFDADTHESEAVHNRYQDLYDGTVHILIGTQMIAKGLDLPNLTLVGVIQADNGLMLPDYLAEERVFQLLCQVIGRVGRSTHPGEVVIQTYQPDHPVLRAALQRDYTQFYQTEIKRRESGRFPPFRYLLKLTCSYKTEKGAVTASKKMAEQLRRIHPNLEILGPTPSFYERQGGAYRWQIIVKSKTRSDLATIAGQLPAGWQADLDTGSLL